jgi:hypothetical protein
LATWSRVDLGQEEEYLALILNLRYSNFFSIRVKLSNSIFFSIFGRNFGGQATFAVRDCVQAGGGAAPRSRDEDL